MKKILIVSGILIILCLVHVGTIAAQSLPTGSTISPFKTVSTSTISPRNASSGLQLPSIPSATCLGTDASGTFKDNSGNCGGGASTGGVQSVASSATISASASTGTNVSFSLVASYLQAALQALNGATSSNQTIVGTANQINVATVAGVSNSTTTLSLAQTYLTAALVTLNGMSAANQAVIAGSGLSYVTSTAGANATTTITLSINGGNVQNCANGTSLTSLSGLGIITCTVEVVSIAGVSTSSISFVAGTGSSITTSTNSITFTNTGVTSLAGQGCVTASNATGTVSLTVTCGTLATSSPFSSSPQGIVYAITGSSVSASSSAVITADGAVSSTQSRFASSSIATLTLTTVGGYAVNGNITFTNDNTNDIGTNGASRPRDVFVGRNLTVGNTLTITPLGSTASPCLTITNAAGAVGTTTCPTALPLTLLTTTSTNGSTTATNYVSIATSTFSLSTSTAVLVTVAGVGEGTGTSNSCEFTLFVDGVDQDAYGSGLSNTGGVLSSFDNISFSFVTASLSAATHNITIRLKATGSVTPVCLSQISNFAVNTISGTAPSSGITTINGMGNANAAVVAGTGLSVATSSSGSNSTTTLSLTTPVTVANGGTGTSTISYWEFLGSCTIQSASSTCGSGVTIAARDELMVVVRITGYGGGDIASLRFNGDTGSNYYSRYVTIAIGGTSLTNAQTLTTNFARLAGATQTTGRSIVAIISNNLGTEKIGTVDTANGTGAVGTAPVTNIGGMIGWGNTSAQITSVQLITQGGSTMNASSAIMIFGKNF